MASDPAQMVLTTGNNPLRPRQITPPVSFASDADGLADWADVLSTDPSVRATVAADVGVDFILGSRAPNYDS